MIKTAFTFGGSYVVGEMAGGWIASKVGVTDKTMVTATKIGIGVVAFMVLASIL